MDVLIVAHQNDGVVVRLRKALEDRGGRVTCCDGPSAARLVTIRIGPKSILVVPSLPMFIRLSGWWSQQPAGSEDERFLRSEAYATFWAAAALSRSPVINRPGRDGPVGRLTCSALAAIQGLHTAGSETEIHVSGREVLDDADERLWGENSEFRVAPVAQFEDRIPLRARKVNPDALYEMVTVVGERGFSSTTDSRTAEFQLVARSVAIARKVNVHFATITWAVDESGVTPARLNPAPQEYELRYHWNEVADALCDELMR